MRSAITDSITIRKDGDCEGENAAMKAQQIQAEALRIVDEVARRNSDLELTEYHDEVRYRADYPFGMRMRDHNAIVRGAMREAIRRGISCVRSVVR